MKPTPLVAALSEKLTRLQQLNPEKVKALDVLVTMAIEDERGVRRAPSRRTLLARLQAVHPGCHDAGFEQEPPRPSGANGPVAAVART